LQLSLEPSLPLIYGQELVKERLKSQAKQIPPNRSRASQLNLARFHVKNSLLNTKVQLH